MSGTEPVVSPCTSVCRIRPEWGLCEGCLRSAEEIASWLSYSPAQRRRVLAELAERRRRINDGQSCGGRDDVL